MKSEKGKVQNGFYDHFAFYIKPVFASEAKQSRSSQLVKKTRLPRRSTPRNDGFGAFLQDHQYSF
jgi:hypothetical protein